MPARKTQQYVTQAQEFLREYTQGLRARDLRRLFDQDASRAYSVLTRDQTGTRAPKRGLRRLLHTSKVLFLGLSFKLSPARRLLFVACLASLIIGILRPSELHFTLGRRLVQIEYSPLWFLLTIGGLLWLLTMELVDRVRVRDELEVARKLQDDLLPDRAPAVPGYEFAHSYRTANEVGGDYYDFQLLPDGRIALIVADASGHGIAAGLLMAIANATLKTAIDLDPGPSAVARLLNTALCRTGDRRAFMTLFYGVLDPATGELEYTCAGHPFPLRRRRSGEIEELGVGSLPLGLRPRHPTTTSVSRLDRGETLLLYTDGLPEAVAGAEGEAFGFPQLRNLLIEGGSAEQIHDRVLRAFDLHIGGEPLTDDVTLVVVTRG